MLTIILGAIGALLDILIILTIVAGIISLPFLLLIWLVKAIKG